MKIFGGKKLNTLAVAALLGMLALSGCRRTETITVVDPVAEAVKANLNLPSVPFNYARQVIPNHILGDQFARPATSSANPVTDAGATLGRVLFYDRNLSRARNVSCASCHKQENAFSDNVASSVGDNGNTPRNSMPINTNVLNFSYNPSSGITTNAPQGLFWDGRASTVETLALMPIQDPVEMNLNLTELQARLRSLDYYKPLFKNAFGDETINTDRISRALAQFMRSIQSFQSKFDIGVQSNFTNFTPQESLGRQIFIRSNCTTCHAGNLFITNAIQSNGLEVVYRDRGRGAITNNPADNGTMRPPSLRNIELTSPYMHDGRFRTLEEVVEFYNSGVQPHANLSSTLRANSSFGTISPRRLNLTNEEKTALVAFLKTLTDRELTRDPKWSNPFIR